MSEADLEHITSAYNLSNGKINTMIATAREGTYSAKVTKRMTDKQFKKAVNNAEASLGGKKYQSEGGMWKAVNKAYTSEFAKIGVMIAFERQHKTNGNLVTQKIGTYYLRKGEPWLTILITTTNLPKTTKGCATCRKISKRMASFMYSQMESICRAVVIN